MSRIVPIEIFNIAKTAVEPKEVLRWLSHLGAEEYANSLYDEETGIYTQDVTDPALLIALAAKRCYMSFEAGLNPNVTKVRSDFVAYIDNILKSGHGSVLEHSTYTFAIEGVSRVFTGEMNRHRAGVGISEGSMRFIRFTDIPYWLPTSIRTTEEEDALFEEGFKVTSETTDAQIEEASLREKFIEKKKRSQWLFTKAFKEAEENYVHLMEIWGEELAPDSPFKDKKNVTSMMRRVVPMGVATGGVWTMNIRSVRHVMAMRASPAAEEEILHVFSRIVKVMIESEPMLCGDFHQVDGFWAPKYPKV